MRMKHWMTLVALVLCIDPASGQNAEQGVNALQRLDGFSFTVLYSAGHEERARAMAQLCERTMVCMDGRLDFIPALQLKVLAQVDWSAHTAFPVYGMPHPVRDTTLVLAAEDNDFWRSFVPDTAQLPEDLVIQVRSAYGTPDGGLSMQPFFDLLVLHELAHLYHLQRPVDFPRLWLGELFANVFLHTFIAAERPDLLPALTVFPRMVVARGTQDFQFTTLPELEANYELIASQHPTNYGWYQCRWHSAAASIYDRGGAIVLRKFWEGFTLPNGKLDDAALAELLREKVHPSVAEVMTMW